MVSLNNLQRRMTKNEFLKLQQKHKVISEAQMLKSMKSYAEGKSRSSLGEKGARSSGPNSIMGSDRRPIETPPDENYERAFSFQKLSEKFYSH